MSVHLERGEVERFRRAITQSLGLEFEDAKLGYLGDLLRQRARETGSRSIAGYLSNFDSSLKASTERVAPLPDIAPLLSYLAEAEPRSVA